MVAAFARQSAGILLPPILTNAKVAHRLNPYWWATFLFEMETGRIAISPS